MVGELIISFGVKKLLELLSQDYEQFQGVNDQVTDLKRDLSLLSSFLKDADAKKHTSAVVKNCVDDIKEIIYDAEDIIETFLLNEEIAKTSFGKRVRKFASTIVDRGKVASNIGGISKRISKVIRTMKSFGVQEMIVDGSSYSHILQERQREMRQEFARGYESNLVGLETKVKKLVGYFVEEDNIQVVSITGMGGVGKTTLARLVFNHEMVKHKFDGLAWVPVSQEFSRKLAWQKILQDLRPHVEKKKISEMTESTLQDELFRLLESSKSLIVLDDIWKEEDWDRIKQIFPPGKGWKVLLTSRNESVAVRGDTTFINFKSQCLSTEESWTLLQLIAFPKKDASEFMVDEEMEEMGKEMIKHCGGLPLAIKVLGGFLAAKYTIHDWKRVFEDIGSGSMGRTNLNDGDNSLVYHVLSMSFEELPSYLKHCFLYLAHFPEDDEIDVSNLSYYWAAEGILIPRKYDGETIRDVGDSYIDELVKRNIVISERDSRTSRFETCQLHDTMRELCLLKAKEENFLQFAGTCSPIVDSQSPCRSRRLVCKSPTKLHVERDINNCKLRSLIVLDDYGESWMLSGSSFKRLELLRVLDLYKAEFQGGKLPKDIGKLIHLKYLSLREAKVSHLPSSLGDLILLIYLNINVYIGIGNMESIIVPNVLMGMQELRYLALPTCMSKDTKLELSKLVNLETLEEFTTENISIEDLPGMVRLRTLVMTLTSDTTVETLYASIGGLRHLENLEVADHRFDSKEGLVLDFVHLKKLSLRMYMQGLPRIQHLPSNLTTISLDGCGLVDDPMPILEKLLHLYEVKLIYNSFCGRRMVCSGGGFPRLHKLRLCGLERLEEWIVEEGSIPFIHTVSIWGCQKLKQVPLELLFITSLNHLNMDKIWEERFLEGGEYYYKVLHIPCITFRATYDE
ncbi:P-loop containing nucleoside triphosphate hydrolase [Arabidopsis thaliana x Arabidopsis arenosa]|uniref:P-loop containing nucleoside triphosphate hydrolase n=1 Tax=Arabidopsis thaliana x Arabidopsis arenosa TaxID=1240361 RepID=A0A8T2BH42_9BRAS|nr:P-loop containing nucleoside triphosphate hydrolase [Arabidopsis thaliana x Arabidopsis arenosa]